MALQLEVGMQLALTKREFTVITKALSGALRPEERAEAAALGEALLREQLQLLRAKVDAAEHALAKAAEFTKGGE